MRPFETANRLTLWGCGAAVLVSGLLSSGCRAPDDTAALKEKLTDQVLKDYIAPYRQGDVEKWLEVFADDAVALHDGLPALEGKEAIREFGLAVATNFDIRRMDVVVDEVRIAEDWAWTRGRYDALLVAKSDNAPPGVAGERRGKFLLIWARPGSGDWRVILDMGNSTAAGPAAERAAERGAALYFPCVSCHFQDGSGSDALGAPAIAGLDAEYVSRQLRHFRDGVRGASLDDLHGRQMNLIAATFPEEQDIIDVSQHIAAMKPASFPRTVNGDIENGAQLYESCITCHGARGEGNPALNAPALNLSQDWYVLRQLRHFRDGVRGTGAGDSLGAQMRVYAEPLSDGDARDLAAYIGTL